MRELSQVRHTLLAELYDLGHLRRILCKGLGGPSALCRLGLNALAAVCPRRGGVGLELVATAFGGVEGMVDVSVESGDGNDHYPDWAVEGD